MPQRLEINLHFRVTLLEAETRMWLRMCFKIWQRSYLEDVCNFFYLWTPSPLVTVTIMQPPFLSSAFWVPPSPSSAEQTSIKYRTKYEVFCEEKQPRLLKCDKWINVIVLHFLLFLVFFPCQQQTLSTTTKTFWAEGIQICHKKSKERLRDPAL